MLMMVLHSLSVRLMTAAFSRAGAGGPAPDVLWSDMTGVLWSDGSTVEWTS